MRALPIALALAATASLAVALHAQQMPSAPPGARDASRITGGTYAVDPGHTQVLFAYNHLGFTRNMGIISSPASGSLALDPKAPGKAQVSVVFPVANIRTGVQALDEHLMKPDFFDAAKFPTASFKSTSVSVDGNEAEITGNLTIHGVTKEVTLDAEFIGAGTFTMQKKTTETVGFDASAVIKRSDFGIGGGVPLVGDTVELKITAAFEK